MHGDVIFTMVRVKVDDYSKYDHKTQEMLVSSDCVAAAETAITAILALCNWPRKIGDICSFKSSLEGTVYFTSHALTINGGEIYLYLRYIVIH